MFVDELNREQLIQLKQNYLDVLNDSSDCEEVVGTSYDKLANADEIVPDDVIFDYYNGVDFSEDDFWDFSYDDAFLKKKWQEFSDVPINYDSPDHPDGAIENDWFVFSAGADRINDIWRWFDEHYSKGVYKLMFPNS